MRRTTERVVVTAASHVLAACMIGAAAELPQEAYVWQRAWTEPLKHMIRSQGGAFQRVVPLGAEIAFAGDRPRVVRVDMDHASLRAAKCPVGVALRVGPYPGPFAKDSAAGGGHAGMDERGVRAGGVFRRFITHQVKTDRVWSRYSCLETFARKL